MSQLSEKQTDWQSHYERGVSAADTGDLQAACGHFTRAIEIAPDELDPRFGLGYALELLGYHSEALRELELVNELSPGYLFVQTEIYLCERALSGQLENRCLSTIRRLQQLTETGRGASSEALSLSRQVIDSAPECALGHYFLGRGLFEEDRAQSESALRRCMELSPDNTTAIDALTHIGLHREAAGDQSAASMIWTDVVKTYFGNPHTEQAQAILDQRQSAEEPREADMCARTPSQASEGCREDRQLTEDEIREHDRAYQRGWSLIERDLLLADADPSRRLGRRSRKRLQEAIGCFEAALNVAPDSWPSLWALGKIHQRLGELQDALDYFARAYEIDPSQPDVAREAGITATDIGDGPTAVRFTKAAIVAKPTDSGLISNLALALLISGDVAGAQSAAAEAASRAPHDPVAMAVRDLIVEVSLGKRPRPKSGLELR